MYYLDNQFNMDILKFIPTVLLCLCFELAFADNLQARGPRFLIEPPSRVVFSNSSGTAIPCTAEGYPQASTTWVKHDGEVTEDLSGLRYIRHDGTLVFPPFPAEDYRADVHAAIYRCEASNSVGVIGSRDVRVTAVLSHTYEIQLFDEFVLRKNVALLHCPVPSYADDYMKVTSWERKDGLLITPTIVSGKYGMLHNGDLYIKDTTEHDNGYSYRCHLENTVTKEKTMSTNFARVIVSEPHHKQPPRITRRISRVTFQAGERASVACIAQGYPVPAYKWRKQFGEELSISRIGNVVHQENGILLFEKIHIANSGKYSCHVSNSMGSDEMTVEIIVEAELQAYIEPSILRIDNENNATFNCSISGFPVGNVLWRKDMRFIENGLKFSFPVPTMLKISKVSKQDAGMYQCFAAREYSVSQAAAQLVINDVEPKFKTTFPEKMIRSGSYVSLLCVASGNPSPQMKWTLDGIWPVSTRPGLLVSTYLSNQGDIYSYVNITSVDVKDSGVYSCEAANDAGRISHARRLNVFGTLFVRHLNNLSALSGERFSVICPFGGYPFDAVTWKRDGRQLPINQRQRVFPNGTMEIDSMELGVDDGLYSCEVTYGQEQPASRTFSIIIRTPPRVSNITFPNNLQEGMRTAVSCIVLTGDPPVTMRWLKDGLTLNENDLEANIVYGPNGYISTLMISTLSIKHNGNYTCIATNDIGSGSISSALLVKVRPRWILEPRDTSAVVGLPARLDCQATGVPQPHIRWKMSTSLIPENFKTIVSSSHVHILVNGSLNFKSVEPFDEGSYLCEASNGVGNGLSTVVRLSVHSSPRFETKFSIQIVRRGEKVFLPCNAYGDALMVFTWKKNGVLLDFISTPRYSLTTELLRGGEGSQMIIEKAEREDSATFTCTATNDFGEDTITFQITVQDVPDAPQNLEVHDVGSRSVRLTWNRPFDGNSPILKYSAAWRSLKDQSSGGPLTTPGDETTLTIRGLNPKTRYFFRVMCENILGESQYGAEVAVTTLEEPPRDIPSLVKASVISSKAVNVTWQKPKETTDSSNIDGFYIGYKIRGTNEPYTFKSVPVTEGTIQFFEIYDLKRYTEYFIIVQPYNSRGAGPPSDEVHIRTMEFDAPTAPSITSYYTTARTIKISWDVKVTSNAPVTGYVLNHRMEGSSGQEIKLKGDVKEYVFHNLQCGTKYFCYIIAVNSAGYGNKSETIAVKTDGNAPIAPDKRFLLSLNHTTLFINLNSWHNGGCPIRSFIIQYKANGQQDWTLVSNNVIPEQQNLTVMDLIPGTWYSLLMKAKNDAGVTDAEYVFATLTLKGEFPPRPSEMNEIGGSFYRHLLITVPVVSSAVVLIVVLCVVCLITRRRTSGRQTIGSDGTDMNDHVKPESMPLSSTYESGQEPAYFPTPYAASRVPGYNRESSGGHPGIGNQQNMGTFGSSRSGYTYDIPYPRKMEKSDIDFETAVSYYPAYIKEHQRLASCDLTSRKCRSSLSWRSVNHSPSSGESDDGRMICIQGERIVKEEARESETECDRIWKSLEECKYETHKGWVEHSVSIIT